MKPIIEQLTDFIQKANKRRFGNNEWLEDHTMHVYVRKSPRIIKEQMLQALDIANIEVVNKGQGTGGKFFEQAHAINPWQVTYFESVLNPGLGQHLLKAGYVQDAGKVPPCYYKLKG